MTTPQTTADAGVGSVPQRRRGLGAGRRGFGFGLRLGAVRQSGERRVGRGRRLGFDLVGRLVVPQALERGLPHHPVAGPPGKLDLGHEFGAKPVHPGLVARGEVAAEGTFGFFALLQGRQDALYHGLAVARADAAEIDEVIPAMGPDEQRPEAARRFGPAADHDLMATAALRLGPAVGAARPIGGIEPL